MAKKKISELAVAETLTGEELVPVVQGGVTKRTTIGDAGSTNLHTYVPPFSGGNSRTQTQKNADVASVKDYGAVGDGLVDDTAALTAAGASGRRVYCPDGNYRVTAAIPLLSDTELFGDGKGARIFLDTATTNVSLFTANTASNIVIEGLTIDGGLNGTHTQGNTVVLIGCTNCRIEGNHFQNSPRESVLIRDVSTKNKVLRNTFDRQGGGAGQIYFLTDCTDNEASFNHFNDSAGGCIWLSGRIMRTKLIGNVCVQSDFELIGVRWDCGYGEIVGNTARSTGDNGISVTGYGWTVTGNTGYNCDFAAIGVYGSRNTVSANICVDNGKSGGSTNAGLLVAAQFGGLAADNVISDNLIRRIDGDPTEQFYGIRISSTSYTAWANGQVITTDLFRTNNNNLYVSTNSGTTGATPPTHTTGTASDGAVTWLYIGTFQNTSARPAGNRIGHNKIANHTGGNIQRFGVSPQNFLEEDENSPNMFVGTAWSTGVAKVIGDVVYHLQSNGVAHKYRATTSGTTGATPPTHSSGSSSDGGVSWFFLGQGQWHEVENLAVNTRTMKTLFKIECIDSTANAPGVFAGTFNPENVLTAANGSLYMRSNSTDNIAVYLKTGTTNTAVGWQLVATRVGGTTANRPASPQPWMMYFDSTLGKPIWRNNGNTAWVDATGTVV